MARYIKAVRVDSGAEAPPPPAPRHPQHTRALESIDIAAV